MRESLPPLPGLQAFESAARHGSFALAADELHLTPAAISQRIRSLESHLGVRLFERLARGVRLTDLGRAYLPAVREGFDDIAAATSGLFGPASRDQLTVRTQVSYAATWLAPHLHHFQAEHPEIDVRIVGAVWSEALRPGEVDLDIHQGRGAWAGVRSDLLHHDRAVVVHGPGHLDRWGPLEAVEDLAERPRVQVLGFDDVWQRLLPDERRYSGPTVVVDTTVAALELVAAGTACAVVPERFTRTAVRAGRVHAALGASFPMRQAHYLLRPLDDAGLPSRARTFLAWLADLDTSTPALFDAPVDI